MTFGHLRIACSVSVLLLGISACLEPDGIHAPETLSEFEIATQGLNQGQNGQGNNGKGKTQSYEFAARRDIVHGVSGDEQLVFVTEALAGRVIALDRFSGHEVGELPLPPDGFLLPFGLRSPRTGHVVVLDSGGFPDPFYPSIPRIYEYEYEYRAHPNKPRFEARLVRSVIFDGLPVVFAEDLEVLDDGRVVVSESVLGGLWVVRTDDTIVPGIIPSGFAPEDAVPGLNPCFMPTTSVGGIPFSTEGNYGPGVGSLAHRDGYLYFGNTCLGGVRRVPLATLEDPARAPHERGVDIELVSPRPQGVPVESLKGLTFNRWDSRDDRMIATDPIHLRLLRIDVHTGAREVIADDPVLFNFPVSAQFLPPAKGRQPIVVASDQEHRLAALNASLEHDLLSPPFVVTQVLLNH